MLLLRILAAGAYQGLPSRPSMQTPYQLSPMARVRAAVWPQRSRQHSCRRVCQATPVPLPRPPGPEPAASPFLRVVLPTALALLLCNMDRICFSVAILPMSAEFGWPASLQGVIQSAFLWGYMATQLVGGALADKHGGKRVLAGGILWFSAASLLLPVALSPAVVAAGLTVPAVMLCRALVGLGEGVALPSMSSLMASHVDPSAKALGLGMAFSGFHLGNPAGLLLSPLLLLQLGWRGTFTVFGLLGLPVLAFFLLHVPDKPLHRPPADSGDTPVTAPQVPMPARMGGNDSDTADVTLWQLMSKTATWAIILVTMVNNWGYFIFLNWMPYFFNKALGLDLRASAFTAVLPFLVMAAGSSASGALADGLIAHGAPVTAVRKLLQSAALLLPAAALLLLSALLPQPSQAQVAALSPALAVACTTLALGAKSLGLAGYVANMSDIAPRHAGKVYGLASTFGSLAGIAGTTAAGYLVEATNSFTTIFQLTAAMYVAGAAVWNMWCTGERVFA